MADARHSGRGEGLAALATIAAPSWWANHETLWTQPVSVLAVPPSRTTARSDVVATQSSDGLPALPGAVSNVARTSHTLVPVQGRQLGDGCRPAALPVVFHLHQHREPLQFQVPVQ